MSTIVSEGHAPDRQSIMDRQAIIAASRKGSAMPMGHGEMMALASKLHEEKKKEATLSHRLRSHARTALKRLHDAPRRSNDSKARNRLVIDHKSKTLLVWDVFLIICVLYSVIYLPLDLALPQTRWKGHSIFDIFLDVLFVFDVVIRFRTTFRDRGYEVDSPKLLALRYLSRWFFADLISSVPYSIPIAIYRSELAPTVRLSALRHPVEWLGLLRFARIGRLARKGHWLAGNHILHVPYLVFLFVLLGHWLGLMWYMIAIAPLEEDEAFDDMKPWIWLDDASNQPSTIGIKYVCSLYWALTVMTNLKGHGTHETRQCLWHDPLMVHPLLERSFTIITFICGAVFFSVIYGNIAQFIQSLYAAGLRYRQRVQELGEFAKFHNVTPSLREKIFNYVEFQWSVTNGINVDTIAQVNGLPPHLQLEMKVQLNKRLVEQVTLFVGCSRAFFEALVCKLQSCICIAGDFVFYKGEVGSCMYFIKRGLAEVVVGNDVVVANIREGGYFGELALLADEPRSADVRAVSDLVMLSLNVEDLDEVLDIYPQARQRMQAAAAERLKKLSASDSDTADKLKASDGTSSRRGSRCATRRESNSARGGIWARAADAAGVSRHSKQEAQQRQQEHDRLVRTGGASTATYTTADGESFGSNESRSRSPSMHSGRVAPHPGLPGSCMRKPSLQAVAAATGAPAARSTRASLGEDENET